MDEKKIVQAYEHAKQVYAEYGVDLEKAIEAFQKIRVSTHCWQLDDVTGYEKQQAATQNVITGNYPGKARNAEELRADLEKVFAYSPLKHKVNLHQIYADCNGKKDRSELLPEDFKKWADWAKQQDLGLDFNPSFFAHTKMDDGMSLASPDKKVRDYWIKVGKNSRKIAESMGHATGIKCVNDIWIPDGLKDVPANRASYRENLIDSLDQILEEKLDKKAMVDVVEGKLFGIGTECFVVGSHDFYLSYAAQKKIGMCLDSGHFHPTEQVSDKISALAPFFSDILLHVSRGVRWDSDHVVIQSDELFATMQEIKRGNLFDKVHIGLDYFDASINRVAALVIGLRATGKALLAALTEPTQLLFQAEEKRDYTSRLALLEECKNLPLNAVWDYICLKQNKGVGRTWLDEVKTYEKNVLSKR